MRESAHQILNRFCFFFGAILSSEILLQLFCYGGVFWENMPYIMMFSALYGLIFVLACGIFKGKGGFIAAAVLLGFSGLCYMAQYVYYALFKTPLQVYSIGKAGKVMEFADQAVHMVARYILQALLFLVPLVILFVWGKNMFERLPIKPWLATLIGAVVIYAGCCGLLATTDDTSPTSPYTLYYNDTNVPASQKTLGVLTTMRIDTQRTIFGFTPKDAPQLVTAGGEGPTEEYDPNIINIDFSDLAANENNTELLNMHNYFAAQEPSYKNDHTGMLEGYNLIFIVAEGFYYPLLKNEELYPTLNKIAREGWNFTNFYSPLFNVSTSDGEYAVLTGLLPKSGIWSFSDSSDNHMPFVLGNQFAKLDYEQVLAYHNHTYTYYDRHLSHPNLGYDYYGVGNGLNVKVTWPESDLEMAEVTVDDYASADSFHVYYLTVSGHLEYNFQGNQMAVKHRDKVEHLPYSDSVKAYLACNIEFDLMLEKLITQLESAGQLENTVIAFTADHYPYGLTDAAINELVGHSVESTFELYRNAFVIWSPSLEPQINAELMSSLDILPTLSNLFGLEYDSRLLMGRDVFSSAPPLVMFNDRSWITREGAYDANIKQWIGDINQAYVDKMNSIVYSKFLYSGKILENDYYRLVVEE